MNKKMIISVVVIALVSFAAGRYTAKSKEIKETNKKEDITKNTEKTTNKHKKTKTVVITNPDGSKKEVTIIDENTKSDTNKNENIKKDTSTKTTTEYGSKNTLRFGGLAGVNLSQGAQGFSQPIYGGYISRQLLGPVEIGAFGLSNGIVGTSIGLSF